MKNFIKLAVASIIGVLALTSLSYAKHHEKKHHDKKADSKKEKAHEATPASN